MRTLIDFAILKEYERVKKRGDKLVEIGSMIEWEADHRKRDRDAPEE
jgi:hypothetical protein